MHLYVYSSLTETARAHLLAQLPAGTVATFRLDLPPEQQQAALQSAHLLLGNPPAAWFSAGFPPQLQFWQIDSAGFERYTGLRPGFPVVNVGDYFAWPCAETMVAGVLALYRRLPELALLQSRREWVGGPLRPTLRLLRDQRVVILGAGAIGLAVRRQLSGFGCAVQLLARTSPEAQLHSREELLAALPQTDLVINCLPGSADNFFSAELIGAMPPGSVYASVGRGNTTDEHALVAALRTGHLGGAVLDVTRQEPLPADNPLWTLPNVLLTQHTGGGQPHEDEGKVDVFLRNLHRFRHGEPLPDVVNMERGY
ncbi:D-2-hydroxyacid dehydrogenase [Hymenobacter busanensis]|uniref:D-2-hydroxyacid dehydrogenase n=1 Tax=Hymenobacter busanensis TaxID=2607656 RepID=A0A7L4ZVW4_9BACT|nr:D-2-hydroxyacid dehydrogenase [Hymenobacter busanensis]KAA9332315.1 D-2-hydroxyacid dehydrogenase [Hymenobacter busanensis]QHJ07348.1 D-2-hydroxyacid dehydrogenase [Hymenobacter busanensis]